MNNRDSFKGYHPLINFLYFGLVLVFSITFMHPLCLGISLSCAVMYSVYLNGRKAVQFILLYMLPIFILSALINPAFNHEGRTILMYLPNGNPLTLESMIYGSSAGAMIVAVIAWFSCYNAVISSDKFVYLFGRVIPTMSLILSMTLRFVPKFRAQIKVISNAQKCMMGDGSNGGVIEKVKNGITILSIMVTWALEDAIETADSMKSRGYGLHGRTAFSIYKFEKRDKLALIYLLLCGSFIIAGACLGGLRWRYYPTMRGVTLGVVPVSVFLLYLALCSMPLIINIREDRKWRAL